MNRTPTDAEKRREYIKTKIQDIYDASKQNYGAPKITRKLRQNGEIISERTVGKYMKEMGIKAQWVKPWTITTIDSNFSNELQNLSLIHISVKSVITLLKEASACCVAGRLVKLPLNMIP